MAAMEKENNKGQEYSCPSEQKNYNNLEQTAHLSGIDIHINPPEGGIGTRSRHEADRPGARAEELCSGVNQNVSYGQGPALGHSLDGRVMREAQVRLDHHGGVVRILWIVFQHLCLGFSFRQPGYTVSAVYFLCDERYAVAQLHLQRVEELKVVLFITGVDDRISQFQRSLTALEPVL